MLSILALSAALMQEPPAPPAPETRTRVFVRSTGDGPGLDKDGDGQVTREEFSAPMADAFADLDKNSDGRLSTDELASGPGEPGDHVFVVGGRDGPGGPGGPRRVELRGPRGGMGDVREVIVLGGPEGTTGLNGLNGLHSGRTMQFGRPDGGPGESRIEIRRMGGPEGGPDRLDKDGDGKVSEAEFTSPLREAFARMDADRSGFIEEGERGADGDVQVFTHRIETREGRED
ncbi:MAG: hypothetical protein EON90_02750 [Brevundimonas sp.]|nr:MAG: hypothetical protein EON90_02750 [Brevundimonas sp.]